MASWDNFKKRRDMDRFGYRKKIIMMGSWKVEEKGQVRGKEARQARGLLPESIQEIKRTCMRTGALREERT